MADEFLTFKRVFDFVLIILLHLVNAIEQSYIILAATLQGGLQLEVALLALVQRFDEVKKFVTGFHVVKVAILVWDSKCGILQLES